MTVLLEYIVLDEHMPSLAMPLMVRYLLLVMAMSLFETRLFYLAIHNVRVELIKVRNRLLTSY